MPNWTEFLLQWITLTFMLVGLLGLIIPIFPGLTVIWLAMLIYAIVTGLADEISTLGWVVFGIITVLMLAGNVVDNIIIARKVRDTGTPWLSIGAGFAAGLIASLFLTPFAGLAATPLAMFAAEYYRLRDKRKAFDSTKAWMIGFGWAFAARFSIGAVMIGLWLLWAWS
jgi:hypothetical protein